MKNSSLTLRSITIGFIGLIIITASSMYVALRMGALPWPTVFVTVLSMAALKRAKNSSLQEINVTHTIMSSGAMVAGGLAFTIPGVWIMNPNQAISSFELIVITISGAILGTLFTAIFRHKLIEEEKLPYPMGIASYNTLEAKGEGAKTLFSTMAGSTIFTALRDGAGVIPSIITPFKGTILFPALSIWISPMAMGIGAIIGPVLSGIWFLGAIIGFYIITPIGLLTNFFSSLAEADSFRSNLGIGLMIGTGLGVFIKALYDMFIKEKSKASKVNIKRDKLVIIISIMVIAILTISTLTSIKLSEAILLVLGIYLTTYLSATLTGQTGVNPMEIFAILVLLFISFIFKPGVVPSFLIAGTVAVACGLTGDVMNDLKCGHLVGTKPKDQLLGECLGGVVGSLIAIFTLLIMKESFGGFGTEALPAPQAQATAAMLGGITNKAAFIIGISVGILLYLFRLPSATLGLGVYLPIYISSTMAVGALIMAIVKKYIKKSDVDKNSALISSGLLGGEGITGVVIAIISIFKG